MATAAFQYGGWEFEKIDLQLWNRLEIERFML
jgi:hypothetical protein